MDEDIRAGDLVQLKSGGPKMTVAAVYQDGSASCSWFEGTKSHTQVFMLAVLKKIDSDDIGIGIA